MKPRRRRFIFPQAKRGRPANYVLFYSSTWSYYYVSKRKGRLAEYQNLEHFVAFFTSEREAYEHAITLMNNRVSDMEDKITKLHRLKRAAKS